MYTATQKLKISFVLFIVLFFMACAKKDHDNVDPPPVVQSLVNYAHLDYLFTPVQFETGIHAAGIYIYSESPDYRLVADDDEGFTSVDDVARAALVYMRSDSFNVIEDTRNKVFMLLSFLLEMQAANGYFYNFLLPGDLINKYHANSVAGMNWWSWRAFQALAEAAPLIGDHNPSLAIRINSSLEKITSGIKSDLAGQTQTTKEVSGLTVPQWLPQGSASDQAATLLLALVNYCSLNNDVILEQYISSLAEGVSMMQQGDADHFPYGCFLSWENQWHAYGNEQAYALLKAAVFLSNNSYLDKALLEISNFYPWLINNDYRSDMLFKKVNDEVSIVSEKQFDQIAYGITPMALAAAEAYSITSEDKYADIAGRIAAWYLGANKAGLIMYEKETGRGFDGLSSSSINSNSGAESTIEALLCFQLIEKYPAIKAAVNKYRAD